MLELNILDDEDQLLIAKTPIGEEFPDCFQHNIESIQSSCSPSTDITLDSSINPCDTNNNNSLSSHGSNINYNYNLCTPSSTNTWTSWTLPAPATP